MKNTILEELSVEAFENYLFSKLPEYKSLLEFQDIIYLNGLYKTYVEIKNLEKNYKTKDFTELKNMAQQQLDNAIIVFGNNRRSNLEKGSALVKHN